MKLRSARGHLSLYQYSMPITRVGLLTVTQGTMSHRLALALFVLEQQMIHTQKYTSSTPSDRQFRRKRFGQRQKHLLMNKPAHKSEATVLVFRKVSKKGVFFVVFYLLPAMPGKRTRKGPVLMLISASANESF